MRVALLLACVACGRIGFDPTGTTSDLPDAPAGTITVIMTSETPGMEGMPLEGAYVMFDAGFEVVTRQTDASGTATYMARGATDVHAFRPWSMGWRATSYAYVGGGTTIHVGSRAVAQSMMTFDMPNMTGANTYGVSCGSRCSGNCVTGMRPIPVSFLAECAGQTVDVYATALNGANIIGWQGGGIAIMPGTGYLFIGQWLAPATQFFDFTNVFASSVSVAYYVTTPIDQIETGRLAVAPAGGAASISVPTIDVAPNRRSTFTSEGNLHRVTWEALPASSVFDTSLMTPTVPTLDGDVATRTISWTLGPGATTTHTTGRVAMTEGTTQLDWSFVVPAPVTTYRLPNVPAALAATLPGPAATWSMLTLTPARVSRSYTELITDLNAYAEPQHGDASSIRTGGTVR